MRELKFRAFDLVTNQMSPSFSLFGEFTLLGAVHSWQKECGNPAKTSLEALYDLEIMQWTGLKDHQETEIFVSDIFDVGQTINGQSRFVIVDCIGGYDVRYYHDLRRKYEYDIKDLLSIEEIEVVGNIYQSLL